MRQWTTFLDVKSQYLEKLTILNVSIPLTKDFCEDTIEAGVSY